MGRVCREDAQRIEIEDPKQFAHLYSRRSIECEPPLRVTETKEGMRVMVDGSRSTICIQ
jgi:hypothetical protein